MRFTQKYYEHLMRVKAIGFYVGTVIVPLVADEYVHTMNKKSNNS